MQLIDGVYAAFRHFSDPYNGNCGLWDGINKTDTTAALVPASMRASLGESAAVYPGSCGRYMQKPVIASRSTDTCHWLQPASYISARCLPPLNSMTTPYTSNRVHGNLSTACIRQWKLLLNPTSLLHTGAMRSDV